MQLGYIESARHTLWHLLFKQQPQSGFCPIIPQRLLTLKSLMTSTLPNQAGFFSLYLSCQSKQHGRRGPTSFTDPFLLAQDNGGGPLVSPQLSLPFASSSPTTSHSWWLWETQFFTSQATSHTPIICMLGPKCVSPAQIYCWIPGLLSNCLVGNSLEHLTEISKCVKPNSWSTNLLPSFSPQRMATP